MPGLEKTPNSPFFECGSGKFLLMALIVVMSVYALIGFLVPLTGTDFWWHLKTGELIFNNRALPTVDPFAYTSRGGKNEQELFILTSYWLSQLLYYLITLVGGLKGVIVFRALLLVSMFVCVFVRIQRLGVNRFLNLSVCAAGLILYMNIYQNDRPQIFTFFFATIVIGMIEEVREGKKPSWLLLPIMLVWANLHGGFFLGDVFLGIFAVGYAIQYRTTLKKTLAPIGWALAGIAASLCNPNFFKAFVITSKISDRGLMTWFVTEYVNTFSAVAQGDYYLILLWVMIVLTIGGIVVSREVYWPDILLVLFISCISVMYLRNVAFFAVAMAPVCAFYTDRGFRRIAIPDKTVLIGKALLVLFFGAYFTFSSYTMIRQGALSSSAISGYYPETAVEFIKKSGLTGKMFNDYDWGGFLIWRLYPDHKVFIDGRVMDEVLLKDYLGIAEGSMDQANGEPGFRSLLNRYGIDFIIQRLHQRSGQLQPLMTRILNEADWVPVYLDSRAYIFVRKTAANLPVISRYGIGKMQFVKNVLAELATLEADKPQVVAYRLARAEMLIYLGLNSDAEKELMAARKLAPANKLVVKHLNDIRAAASH